MAPSPDDPPARPAASTPAPRIAGTERVPALDGLRGVAIALVLIFHLYVRAGPAADTAWQRFLLAALSQTGAGVDLFFVLSGYLIGGILLDRARSPNLFRVFYTRRFFRIIPLYALLLLTFFGAARLPALRPLQGGAYFGGTLPLWSYFAFLQNNFMAWNRNLGPWWLVVTWSLAIEEQFYLVMPWVVRLVRRRLLGAVCLLSFVVCPALRAAYLGLAGNPFATIYLLVSHADALLAGVLLAILVRNGRFHGWRERHPRLLPTAAAAYGVVFFGFSLAAVPQSFVDLVAGPSLFAVGFALVLLHVVTAPRGRLAGLLGWRALGGLGAISYFTYLFHLPVQYALHGFLEGARVAGVPLGTNALTLAGLAITLAAGTASFVWFERPLLRLGHRARFLPPRTP